MKKALLTLVAVLVAALVLTTVARADTITIGLQETGANSGNIEVVGTPGPASGVIGLSFGTFYINDVSGEGFSVNMGPELTTASYDVTSSGTGVLTVYVTDSGLTNPAGAISLLSGFTEQVLNKGWTVIESTYYSPSDASPINGSPLFNPGTLVGQCTYTNPTGGKQNVLSPSSCSNQPPQQVASGNVGIPYSLTAEYLIEPSGSGKSNATIDITVPEPATLSLLGFGLLSLFGLRKKEFA